MNDDVPSIEMSLFYHGVRNIENITTTITERDSGSCIVRNISIEKGNTEIMNIKVFQMLEE